MTREKMIDLSFNTERGSFIYRIAGVVVHKDRVLLLTEDRFNFWYLPGGRAGLFETSEEALKREFFEELSEKTIIERILWTTENMYHFAEWDQKHHEITFYYLIRFPDGAPIYSIESGLGKEEFSNEETILRFQWFDIDQLDTVNLVPQFLKKGLKNLPSQPEHLIFNELPNENTGE